MKRITDITMLVVVQAAQSIVGSAVVAGVVALVRLDMGGTVSSTEKEKC